ncbi:MAG: hypothetical protein ACM3SV_11470 [Betaproteobacteria bacterium]
MSCGRVATLLLALAYPALVYFGLMVLEPRVLGALLLLVLLVRHRRDAARFIHGMSAAERILPLALVALAIAIVAANSEPLLRFYPALASFGVLLIFASSLLHPPTLVERIARLSDPELPPQAVRYTRRVTQVWCGFLTVNSVVAFLTVFASRDLWVLWNGLLSYLLMGTLFAGEWLIRRRVRARWPAMS